jgi:hypothetical protein
LQIADCNACRSKQKMPDGFWPSGISMCSSKD